MRLYAVALIIWAATVTAISGTDIANSSDEKTADYTGFRDLPQIVQSYVTSVEARSFGQTGTADHSGNASNTGLSRSSRTSEQGSNGISTTDYFTSFHTTPFTGTTDKALLGEQTSHDVSGYIIPEDVLLIQNAGSFGQKVQHGSLRDRTIVKPIVSKINNDQQNSFRKSFSSTVSPLEDGKNRGKFYTSTTREPFVLSLRKKSSLTEESNKSNETKVPGGSRFESTKIPDRISNVINSTTERSTTKANITLIFANNVTPESHIKSKSRSGMTHNGTTNTTKKTDNVAISTPLEISPSLQLMKFVGPIVVPDLPEGDVVLDYLDGGDDVSLGALKSNGNSVLPLEVVRNSRISDTNNGITSSIMLNPLQVGITLMNADDTDLIDDAQLSAATDVKDYLKEDWQRLTDKKKNIENKTNHSDITQNENHHRVEKEKNIDAVVTHKTTDDSSSSSVEIQKSIELYHSAPIQEIHYPAEYIQQTAQFGATETNNIGNTQKPYVQEQTEELRSNYDVYRGNDAVEKSIVKSHASAFSYGRNQQEHNNVLDDGKSKPSTLVAEYSTITQEQIPSDSYRLQSVRYNGVKPVLLVANQFDNTLYRQTNPRQNINGNNDHGASSHVPLSSSSSTRQEVTSEFVKPYVPNVYQNLQPNPILNQQHPFRTTETRRPEVQQLLLKITPDGSSGDTRLLVPIPRPYPIEKIVEKTVHMPHPIEIEKVIEKKVPMAVPVPVPVSQLFPIHVPVDRVVEKQIRIPHLYPIHVERVIEKRVPSYTIQRLIVQPPSYPLHLRTPTVYQTPHATIPIERPTFVPTSTEKTAEKLMLSSQSVRPYRTDLERPVNGGGHLQDVKFNKHYQKSREPIFNDENLVTRGTSGTSNILYEPSMNHVNVSQPYVDSYGRPLIYGYNNVDGRNYIPTAHISNVKLMILPKKYGNHVILRPYTTIPSYAMPPLPLRRQIVYNLVEKDKSAKDEYIGPVPPRKILIQGKMSSQKPLYFSTSATQSPDLTVIRRGRQQDMQYPGSFRQSKMEYGFKPPMIPSVQYDEQTASKVEN